MPKGFNLKTGEPLSLTHGMESTKFYKVWCDFKARCFNKKNVQFKDYGGRGIKVCNQWLKFENFRDDMHQSYEKHVLKFGQNQTRIDRIDNNKGYSKENCRWVTVEESNNNRRDNLILKFKGKSLTVHQWAKICGIKADTLRKRLLRYKWPIELIFSIPVKPYQKIIYGKNKEN